MSDPVNLIPTKAGCRTIENSAAVPQSFTGTIHVEGGNGSSYSFTIDGTLTINRVEWKMNVADLADDEFGLGRNECATPANVVMQKGVDTLFGPADAVDIFFGTPIYSTTEMYLSVGGAGATFGITVGTSGYEAVFYAFTDVIFYSWSDVAARISTPIVIPFDNGSGITGTITGTFAAT